MAPVKQPSTSQGATEQAISGLAPIHLETGPFHNSIVPLIKKSWFQAVCLFCMVILLVVFIIRVRQFKLDKHPEIKLQKQKKILLENDLQKVKEAQANGDYLSFLNLTRTAIQNQLGLLWHIEPAAISLADIQSRLDRGSPLTGLFSTAEDAAYGGASLTHKQLQDYFITLKTELEKL